MAGLRIKPHREACRFAVRLEILVKTVRLKNRRSDTRIRHIPAIPHNVGFRNPTCLPDTLEICGNCTAPVKKRRPSMADALISGWLLKTEKWFSACGACCISSTACDDFSPVASRPPFKQANVQTAANRRGYAVIAVNAFPARLPTQTPPPPTASARR